MSGGVGRCCKLMVTLGVTAVVLWLVYRPIKPRYYVIAFSLTPNSTTLRPPPADPTNATTLATFLLEIENKNKQMGICHDAISVSLSFGPGRTPVGGVAVVPPFYQGHGKTADKPGPVAGGKTPEAPWAAAVSNGSAVFRVGVETEFRYKVLAWKSRHHSVSVAGDVAVDAQGKKTAEKGIRLSSADRAISGYFTALSMIALVCVVFRSNCAG